MEMLTMHFISEDPAAPLPFRVSIQSKSTSHVLLYVYLYYMDYIYDKRKHHGQGFKANL